MLDEHAARILGQGALSALDPERLFGHWRIMVEDGPKLMGIVSWFGYFWTCCSEEVHRRSVLHPVAASISGMDTLPSRGPVAHAS